MNLSYDKDLGNKAHVYCVELESTRNADEQLVTYNQCATSFDKYAESFLKGFLKASINIKSEGYKDL